MEIIEEIAEHASAIEGARAAIQLLTFPEEPTGSQEQALR
jgi:hypothetical protein